MRIEKTTPIKVIADNGMILTNGEVFSTAGGYIQLGKNDKPENWYEITEAEYQEILKE